MPLFSTVFRILLFVSCDFLEFLKFLLTTLSTLSTKIDY